MEIKFPKKILLLAGLAAAGLGLWPGGASAGFLLGGDIATGGQSYGAMDGYLTLITPENTAVWQGVLYGYYDKYLADVGYWDQGHVGLALSFDSIGQSENPVCFGFRADFIPDVGDGFNSLKGLAYVNFELAKPDHDSGFMFSPQFSFSRTAYNDTQNPPLTGETTWSNAGNELRLGLNMAVNRAPVFQLSLGLGTVFYDQPISVYDRPALMASQLGNIWVLGYPTSDFYSELAAIWVWPQSGSMENLKLSFFYQQTGYEEGLPDELGYGVKISYVPPFIGIALSAQLSAVQPPDGVDGQTYFMFGGSI